MTSAVFIAWRSGEPDAGRWGPVGRVERAGDGYRFAYTKGAESLAGFRPFPEMPDLRAVYESDELFPLFANRLLARSRPEYEAFLTWGGFDPGDPPDPLALLSVTEGRRQTDSIEVFPCPQPGADGCYVSKFFLHGVRWMPEGARERIAKLRPDEQLGLMIDISNPFDPHAVAVRTCDTVDRYMIGYVPRYLAKEVWDLASECGTQSIDLHVVRVNPNAPLQQRVLCRMSACWPDGFQPCSREEFQPIVAAHTGTPGGLRA
ncbi:MAG: DNA-binding protein [Phycisphaerales bacterium]|nr:DNA-binding protein [Phycisphaerales bacterium]